MNFMFLLLIILAGVFSMKFFVRVWFLRFYVNLRARNNHNQE